MSAKEIIREFFAIQKINVENDIDLGKVPDRVLAEKHQVPLSTVFLIRRRRKIPASHVHINGNLSSKLDRKIIEPLLGKEKDISIANRYGVSRERIRQIRSRLHIPRYEIPKKSLTKI